MTLRIAGAFLMVAALCFGAASVRAQTSLNDALIPYLARHQLPAVAAAVVVRGKLLAAGAVGTRRAGTALPVAPNDRFHLGTATQAMTALLAAMQVEAGRLLWTSTIADVFQELSKGMNPALGQVTLEQLLSHTSGVPSDNEVARNFVQRALLEPGNLDDQRYWLVKEWSALPLAAVPGSQLAYSTMNYVIAGAMVERVAGKSWEELVAERIFDPLALYSAGFGPQASLGRIDAPLGHSNNLKGPIEAMLAGPNSDHPPVLGPAGNIHMSVLDFARWAGWQADKGRHGARLITPDTFDRLLRPAVGVDWAPRPLVFHGGSNGLNLAQAWLDPETGFAMVLVTNIGGMKADEALNSLAGELYKKFSASK